MKKIVYFLDVDDCLIETSRLGTAELTALRKSLISQSVPKANNITKEFEELFHLQYDHHQHKKLSGSQISKLEKYRKRLKELQANIIKEFGQVKKWSRECFLYISAEKFKIKLTSNQIRNATFSLWKSITDHNPFYPDALRFLKSCISENQKIYLITSSDCRLQYNGKKDEFTYDPLYSKKLKLKRLDKFIKLGIPKENIFIGDPYDKPDPRIFKEALKKTKKDNAQNVISIMIGDSINNDLLPAKKAGMDSLIWINRNKSDIQGSTPENMKIISSFDEI